jgi:hypothetical protein
MSQDRAKLLLWLREEVIGPAQPWGDQNQNWSEAKVEDGNIINWPDPVETLSFKGREIPYYGNVFYRNGERTPWQEILYFGREAPKKKYGIGLLHPERTNADQNQDLQHRMEGQLLENEAEDAEIHEDELGNQERTEAAQDNDFEVSGQDRFRPSTLGISFLAEIPEGGELRFRFPQQRHFNWQEGDPNATDILLNGYYVPSTWPDAHCRSQVVESDPNEQEAVNDQSDQGEQADQDDTGLQDQTQQQVNKHDQNEPQTERRGNPCWIRHPVFREESIITITQDDLRNRHKIPIDLTVREECFLKLKLEIFPRRFGRQGGKKYQSVVDHSCGS